VALLLAFAIAAQAAIFWGHTRHRLPFDVCLAVLAGPALHARLAAAFRARREKCGTPA
jgi:hypothetical protein